MRANAEEPPASARARRVADAGWDYRAANTKEFTHRFHNYPAMMIPQIARRLLGEYGREGGRLLDPYCGTGTSLVEASIFGMNAVGCDINPHARLIAKAKVAPIPLDALDEKLESLRETLFRYQMSGDLPASPAPDVLNRDYWFSDEASRWLSALRREIVAEPDGDIRGFLWVAFSETVRECSYTKNGEFKLVRMPADKMARFAPDAVAAFLSKLARNRAGLADYAERRRDVDVVITDSNTALGEIPPGAPFDLAITSPPYGDSATTVAYGQFSRLSAEWIGLPARKVDRASMGGKASGAALPDSPATEPIRRIAAVDAKRARQVEAFYIDLANSVRTVASAMASGSTICYVVGNRTVKGVTLPTDEFVAGAFGSQGFRHLKTVVRNIPNKRMPSRNSPSNVAGATASTMRLEYIVVCQRG